MIKQLNLDHSLVLSYIFIYNLFNYFPPNSFCLRDCLFDTKTIGRLPYERVDFQRRLYTFQSTSTDDLTVGFQLSVILKFLCTDEGPLCKAYTEPSKGRCSSIKNCFLECCR